MAAHTISASFVIDTFTITATSGANGMVTPAGVTTVNYGGSQPFTITPNIGYHTVDVLVDGVSKGTISSYTFTNVIGPHTISATFAVDTYIITASAGTGGTIFPNGATTVNYGDDQSYVITPNSGYYVMDVKVDGVSQGGGTELLIYEYPGIPYDCCNLRTKYPLNDHIAQPAICNSWR